MFYDFFYMNYPKQAKPETESRIGITGYGVFFWNDVHNGYRVFFWDDDVLNQTVVVAQWCECSKYPWAVHLKMVNCMWISPQFKKETCKYISISEQTASITNEMALLLVILLIFRLQRTVPPTMTKPIPCSEFQLVWHFQKWSAWSVMVAMSTKGLP